MHAVLTAAMEAAAGHHLTTREALSGIWGSISLCAWIFLLVSSPRLETHMDVARAVCARAIAVEGNTHGNGHSSPRVAPGAGTSSYPCRAHAITQSARDRSHSSS